MNGIFTILALGTADGLEEQINDTIISNNSDVEKVLVSVAHTALEFSVHYPEAFIHIVANTEAKMRLYQMKINKYWKEIEEIIELFGCKDGKEFIPYKPGIKCLSFVGRKKI